MEQSNWLAEQCLICEEQKNNGVHIYQQFICRECESNMVHTEPREEKYQYYLEKLKPIGQPKLYS